MQKAGSSRTNYTRCDVHRVSARALLCSTTIQKVLYLSPTLYDFSPSDGVKCDVCKQSIGKKRLKDLRRLISNIQERVFEIDIDAALDDEDHAINAK